MAGDFVFRLFFMVIFLGMLSISSYFRYRARKLSGTIPRVREGKAAVLARLAFAMLLYLPILLYMINPGWMAWSSFPLVAWLRWLGVAAGILTLPLVYWVFSSIRSNVSETFLTKDEHRLVSHGPYRWVRHPLYSVATLDLVSLGLIAHNWFILTMACTAFIGIALLVTPREEAELIRKFSPEYQEYMRRTGRFAPRLF